MSAYFVQNFRALRQTRNNDFPSYQQETQALSPQVSTESAYVV